MSVGVTRTLQQRNEGTVRQQRPYDYLYDTVCTLSSETDHARQRFRALASVERVKKVPEYTSMFSDLPHHPCLALCLDATDPGPAVIKGRWRGHGEQRLAGSSVKLHGSAGDRDILGVDRWKYFSRPLIPFTQQVPPDVMFARPRSSPHSNTDEAGKQPPGISQRTVETQTDYRDSEAQTDPYSPQYVVCPRMASELLTVAALTWGDGLPAGLAEVEVIKRVRMKRAWEAQLPALNDLTQLDKRKRMMDEMERKEWACRESEIQKLQEQRLDLLRKLLWQREEKKADTTVKRLNEQFSQRQQDKDTKLQKIHKDYIVSIRKLTEKRRKVEGKLERRDIIKDHVSQICAPLSQMDQFSDWEFKQSVAKNWFLNTYEGLLTLEASLPASVIELSIQAPKPKTSKGFVKHATRQEVELMKTHQVLKEKKTQVKQKKPLQFLYKTDKPIPHPPTPEIKAPPEGDEAKELAIIYLQKLLQGRSIQNMMFEGKEKRLELIQELRTTHTLQREEQEKQKVQRRVTLDLQKQRELHNHMVSAVEGYQSGVSGSVMADMLDFLSKELVRLQEERRIHAFTLLAERERCRREAEESGRRQVEERRRREEDEIFRQVVQVHQETVDQYLEDVILSTIKKTADDQAREEIRRVAREINNIAYTIEESRTTLQSEEIVADLVYSFLIPEVQKRAVRDRVKQSQQIHLLAVRHIIHGVMEVVISPPLRTPRVQTHPQRASNSAPHSQDPQVIPGRPEQLREEEDPSSGRGAGGERRE
ncbi:cilia- and flagella-associated protein 91 [Megalops cyprinoides]|uniref:cilia- and flagella-associated protein 91 n=1 Tax=Megalops cyprinoides TaxID=118141 RepID=UPI00186409BF|nr:cilia- and flagella-associated protein 91 [Megalops cyprinoides]